jgi:hypothetical protein
MFQTYLVKSGSNTLGTPEVGDLVYNDEALQIPVKSWEATSSYYGYINGGVSSSYQVSPDGVVAAIQPCSI